MARRTNKKLAGELEGQSDPRSPLEWQRFLQAAQPVMKLLKDDLRARARGSAAVTAALAARHGAEKVARRTADSFVEWQDRFIEQVAAAWMLSCVFVRTLEDRGLLGHNRLAGPGAADSLKLFLELAPSLNERDYLLTTFRELTRFAATRSLFEPRHNPVWLLTPSAEGAKALVQLFQAPHPDSPAFRFGQADTAFLGWIYQDLDEGVRERFALLQTPRFVESFILDRTLEPALTTFGLTDTTLIDPTCGSGHFLLGAFERLFARHLDAAPALGPREAARKALDAVHGADLNPYAVAIARFRLTLAFFDKAGFTRLVDAPALPLHVVVADSLLHNPFVQQGDLADFAPSAKVWRGEEYKLEDEAEARAVLFKQYAAVVGNPPYITVKDAVLREEYRKLYPQTTYRSFSIAVPFTERFFQLARPQGRVGMITANSFMKREFGKKLIEEYLPKVNVDLVVNTSGAYIPGHGTPTVLIFGSHEPPSGTEVDTVLANRGEPSTPEDAEQGLVWRSIVDNWANEHFDNEYISVAKTSRTTMSKHPWSLGGGGASELKDLLEDRADKRLSEVVQLIGFGAVTREDEIFLVGRDTARRLGISAEHVRPLVAGEDVRDWAIFSPTEAIWPYDEASHLPAPTKAITKALWPWKRQLSNRVAFGKSQLERGLPWQAYSMYFAERFRTPLSITFAEVATHNHFVLDRGGKVFNRTAPIIKLPPTATEEDHLALLAYLNSSTACFWMKQVCFDKGNRGEGGGFTSEQWEKFFQFSSTSLSKLPVPTLNESQREELVRRASSLSALMARRLQLLDVRSAFHDCMDGMHLSETLSARSIEIEATENRIRLEQESLDWYVYQLAELVDEDPTPCRDELPAGARAVDVLFATEVCQGGTGRRYFELCRLPPPEALCAASWIEDHDLARSIELIRRNPWLRVLETPATKRTYREGFRPANWLSAARAYLGEISEQFLAETGGLRSSNAIQAGLAPQFSRLEVGISGFGQIRSIGSTLEENAVPYLAALRFTASGLEKHAEWQHTWELQRREDAGETIAHIPVPPKYAQGDYRSTTTWQLRGPLDVPKERFISYPGCESDQDKEPVYGWAGWDHEQRAKALATLYWNRKTEESWSRDRLTPMLAGLLELLPWLKQWHDDPSDDYAGDSPANYFAGFLDGECRTFGLTHEDLRAWRPPEKTRGKKASAKTASAPKPSEIDGDHPEAAAKPEAKAGRKPRAKKTTTTGEAP